MIWIYRRRNSTSARDLAEAILMAGTQARRTKGNALRELNPQRDVVICWGDHFQAPEGLRTLNNEEPINKFREAQKLAEKGVPTIVVRQTAAAARPAPVARAPFQEGTFALQAAPRLSVVDAIAIAERLSLFASQQRAAREAYNRQPVAVQAATETWLPRRNNHVGGNDLLTEGLREPDFYSKKENLTEEYRIHTFRGKSVRAGKKVQRATRPDGTASHPWIRSFDAGWIIAYENFKSDKAMRDLAAKAVKALGLDFAAVDIGRKADGSLIVLEVNRAPGIENNTVTAYVKHILGWVAGKEASEE